MLRKNITGAKYYSNELQQMINLNIATPIDKNDVNFGQSDILLAKDVIKLTENASSEDISEIKTSIDELNKKVQQNSGNITTLDQKFTGLFEVVNTLPNIDDAQLGKIYCVKDTSSTETENKYIEWVKLKNTDDTYKFEKVGEFNATPDLSGYAKLNSSPTFTKVTCNAGGSQSALSISGQASIEYLTVRATIKSNQPGPGTPVFGQKGVSVDVGSEESFVFTLEDGSKVTKSIRVVSTTNSL